MENKQLALIVASFPFPPPVFDRLQYSVFILQAIKNWRRERPGNEATLIGCITLHFIVVPPSLVPRLLPMPKREEPGYEASTSYSAMHNVICCSQVSVVKAKTITHFAMTVPPIYISHKCPIHLSHKCPTSHIPHYVLTSHFI